MTIPPAAVIALRDLSAKWRSWDSQCVNPLAPGTGCMGKPERCEVCATAISQMHLAADDLDAILARVEPQESTDLESLRNDLEIAQQAAAQWRNKLAALIAEARVEPQNETAPAVHHICRLGNTGAWCRLDREWHDGAAKQFDYICSDCGERITVNVSQWRKQEPAEARVEPPPQERQQSNYVDPMVRDDDIPPDVRRELMACAIHNGRISYGWLCDVFRKGRDHALRPILAASPSPPTQEPTE